MLKNAFKRHKMQEEQEIRTDIEFFIKQFYIDVYCAYFCSVILAL
jgi:hypothetical protein